MGKPIGERMASAETQITTLEEAVKDMTHRFNGLQNWMIGTFATALVGVAMLALQLIVQRHP